jgi:transcriptional regulator with GAF, ATPase, and Fis domain
VDTNISVVDSDAMLELILQSIQKLIDYELAVILRYDGQETLSVTKAAGPLADATLAGYTISLKHRRDLAAILQGRRPHLFSESEDHIDTYADIINLPLNHSCLVSPLVLGDDTVGLLTFDHRMCNRFNPQIIGFIEMISTLVAALLVQFDVSNELIERTERLLNERNSLLVSGSDAFRNLIGNSPQWIRVLDSIRLVAATEAPVLVLGETGTGKEEVARAIHRLSSRVDRPFVPVNCSALSTSLAESELFGHEKGSFTGALALRKGRFELADKGTLFLDEVGDLPMELQPKLLRALSDGIFERVGGEKPVKVDVRIIAATNIDLAKAIQVGRFREDLYYRLSVFPIALPPLRERTSDIEMLALHFLNSIKERTGNSGLHFTEQAFQAILAHPWPGNVRELKNALERAAILAGSGEIREEHLGLRLHPLATPAARSSARSVAFAEKQAAYAKGGDADESALPLRGTIKKRIEEALETSGGKIYGPDGAAAALNLKPSTLQSKMKKLGIQRERFLAPRREY